MQVLRALTLGLLVATVWMSLLFVTRGEPACWHQAPRTEVVVAPPRPLANPITVIDLAGLPNGEARGLRDIVDLVRLAPDEAIAAIDDHPVTVSIACGAAPHYCSDITLGAGRYVEGVAQTVASGSYVDVTVASVAASRRVLVLVH